MTEEILTERVREDLAAGLEELLLVEDAEECFGVTRFAALERVHDMLLSHKQCDFFIKEK